MKKIIIGVTALVFAMTGLAVKKPLGHDDFDKWEKVNNYSVSNNGEYAVFAVNPQEGDGTLTFFNTKNSKKIDLPRGYNPGFTADSHWGVALIKAPFQENREAKIKKKTGLELPQDSLAVINLKTFEIWKTPNVASYKLGEKGGDWLAWISVDTIYTPQSTLDDKKAGRTLVLRHLPDGIEKCIPNVSGYTFSENGDRLGATLKKCKSDSLSADGIGIVMLPDTTFRYIAKEKPYFSLPAFDRSGKLMAYVASEDSTETGTKKGLLYQVKLDGKTLAAEEIKLKSFKSEEGELLLNQYTVPEYSYNGRRLIAGVAPVIAPDDTTLVDFEKASLDIWRWDAPVTPPQELKELEETLKHTYPVVIDLATGSQVLTVSSPLEEVAAPDRWDADWALIRDASENIISLQWDYQFPLRLAIKNVLKGEEKEITTAKNELSWLSPADRYVVWFSDRTYHVYDIATGKTCDPGKDIPYPLWDELQDIPLLEREPYGIMGWTENDEQMLVYDRYDVWMLDPTGRKPAQCLTAGEGRKKNLKIRYLETDPEKRFIKKGDNLLFSLFDYESKYYGLGNSVYNGKPEAPTVDYLEPYFIRQVRQGRDSGTYTWIKANFNTSPNVYYTTDISKKTSLRVTDSNPQMGDYSWGTAQLFKWYAYDGSPSEGVLYLPEDFDPDKEYPMIAYFYEIYSDMLYYHYDMEPSWSWINIPFYVSRGYVVFLPDIHYTAGVPGECAWNYVCSGVEEVCRQFPNIDKKSIGIDGQSWGGYQTAYLVTRTNMFACAGSGAPVSNMTSAFGGIRWESGSSRQAQYERGQSRIGRNLWESPALYIANSPVFYADRVETPLLIMHNDADGAVPWYQGIEMFMALRRLGKPVWMLQYNSEQHNLRERRNRKDITKRLQQFFDHYLKGDPMPEWMKNGIPATRKGQYYGY